LPSFIQFSNPSKIFTLNGADPTLRGIYLIRVTGRSLNYPLAVSSTSMFQIQVICVVSLITESDPMPNSKYYIGKATKFVSLPTYT
jgi:hypothetical protein